MSTRDIIEKLGARGARHADWDERFLSPPSGGRFRFVPFHALSHAMQARARAAFSHKSVDAMYDFRDEHYYYPVTRDGKLAGGRAHRSLAIPHALITDPAYMSSLGYVMNLGWPR